ncbi:MAG: hypothetical protein GY729_18615, partial [Desulfobacteraceae bacterium]|nr:hypothetical protein [Desulfobacteraceae bacterium]
MGIFDVREKIDEALRTRDKVGPLVGIADSIQPKWKNSLPQTRLDVIKKINSKSILKKIHTQDSCRY